MIRSIPRRRPPAAARRAVRHLPGRPVPAVGRLRRGQAAGGRRLHGRGAARARPAAASPPTTPATAPTPRRSRAGLIDALAGLRLRRGAVGLLRRHAQAALPGAVRRRAPPMASARGELAGAHLRAGQLPGRRAGRDARSTAELPGARHLPRQPARACASSASSGSRAGCCASVARAGAGRAARTPRSAAASAAPSASSTRRSRPGWSTTRRPTSRPPAPSWCWRAISAA